MRPGRPTRATSSEQLHFDRRCNPNPGKRSEFREPRHAPLNHNEDLVSSDFGKSRSLARTTSSAKMAPRWWPRLVAALLGMALGFGLAPGFGSPARAQDDERTQEAQDRSTSAT